MPLSLPTEIEIDRELARRGLSHFIRLAWPVIEPGQPYVHGWHIDAIAAHLEAVTRGEILRLLINVPPGTMKSLASAVFWPAWEWGPLGMPWIRIVAASHSERYAIRDNLKTRRLIASDWYRERWGDKVKLSADQNAKTKFENTALGFREGMPFSGMTGSRGHRVIIDDPMSVDDAASETRRDAINTTFREAITSRLVDAQTSVIVVIMQRLHEKDTAGLILANDFGYEHLMLPMEFEPERRCTTSIGFTDPRTEPGELLFPARFPAWTVERDKKTMGSYAAAGQLQQRPAPRDGGFFKRSWFEIVDALPAGGRTVRAWDIAATDEASTTGDPDYTAGVKMTETPDGFFYIRDVKRDRLSPAKADDLIKNTASQDTKLTAIRLAQDPGAAGKRDAQRMIRMLAGYTVKAQPVRKDKQMRARGLSSQAEAGNVKLLRGDWNDAFLDELCSFPNAAHDDQVDAATDAFDELTRKAEPVTAGPVTSTQTSYWRDS